MPVRSTYEFRDSAQNDKVHPAVKRRGGFSLRGHRRQSSGGSESTNQDDTSHDGSSSLAYSATSSVQSSGMESNDSSFADIMRVLDGQDSKELAVYLKEKAALKASKQKQSTGTNPHTVQGASSERSIAGESLAYSTDADSQFQYSYQPSLVTEGESPLHGTEFVNTTG
jgi:hypothetical protein